MRFLWRTKDRTRETKIGSIIIIRLFQETWGIGLLSLLVVLYLEILRFSYPNFLNIPSNLENTYDTFLGTVAGIAAIFLGLYFTAISVVAGALFPKVPASVRGVILKNKVSNLYVRSLALLTAITVLLLGIRILGVTPNSWSATIVILLSCFGIFSFVELGFGVFNLFDPASVAGLIIEDIKHSLRSVTIDGFAWKDSSFQTYYQQQSKVRLEALDALVDVCRGQEQLASEPLTRITHSCIGLLSSYQFFKRLIPTKSRWYELVPRHKNWFVADSTEMSIAISTQTSIQPEMIANHFWFEHKIFEITSKTIRLLLERGNIQAVHEILRSVCSSLRLISSNLNVTEGLDFLKLMFCSVDTYLNSQIKDITGNELQDATNIGLLDLKTYSFACIMLDFLGFIRDNSVNSISLIIDQINWYDTKAIYVGSLPVSFLERLESVFEKLCFERKIEGRLMTPKWFIRQFVFIKYADIVKTALDLSTNSLDKICIAPTKNFMKHKKYVYAAHNILQGLDICRKFQVNLDEVKKRMAEVEEKFVIKELTWSKVGWTDLRGNVAETRSVLIDLLVECLPKLSMIKHSEKFLDYFGQAYHFIINECYKMLIDQDATKFEKTFKHLLFSSLVAQEQLRKRLAGQEMEVFITFTCDPLIDILELSGYAKIYSELYERPEIWKVCSKIWDAFLDDNANSKEIIVMLFNIFEYRKRSHRIAPKDIIRGNWRQQLRKEFRKVGITETLSFRPEKYTKKHQSVIIRAVSSIIFTSRLVAAELFIITYLTNHKEAQDIEPPDIYFLKRLLVEELKKKIICLLRRLLERKSKKETDNQTGKVNSAQND